MPPGTGRVTHRRPRSIRGHTPGTGHGGAKQAGERTPVVFGSGAGPKGPSVDGLKTSDAVKLSSRLGKFFRWRGECSGFVVVLAGGQAVPEAAEEASE